MQAMEFAILDQLQKIHHPILDKLMIYASRSSDHGEIWVVIALFLLVFYLQKTKKRKRYVELYRMGNVEKACGGFRAIVDAQSGSDDPSGNAVFGFDRQFGTQTVGDADTSL